MIQPCVRTTLVVLILFLYPAIYSSASVAYKKNATEYNNEATLLIKEEEYEKAISLLEKALESSPDDKVILDNLALTYNNYGVHLGKEEAYIDRAIDYLRSAIHLKPDHPQFKINLSSILHKKALILYKIKTFVEAEKILIETIEVWPDNLNALELLGDVYYFTQRLDKARDSWTSVLEKTKEAPRDELCRKLDKLIKELELEKGLKESEGYYFELIYEEDVVPFDAYEVRQLLYEARRDIGQDFNYFPEHTLIVIIYSPESFEHIHSEKSRWISGLYDGKIRVPVKKKPFEEKDIKKILWHEYTHALIHDLTDNNCPLWLNEGLAKYEESKCEDIKLDLLKTAVKGETLIPIDMLSVSFKNTEDLKQVNLAYQEAYSIIKFIIDRYTFWHINRIMERLKEKVNFDDIIQEELYISLKELQKDWEEFMERI